MSGILEMPVIICLITTQITVWFIPEPTTMRHCLAGMGDITPEERHMVREYLWNFHDDEKGICRNMIRLVMGSVAGRCIIPIQDYLQLDNSARINQPSTLGTNWKWRLKEGQFSKELQKEMLTLATRFGGKTGPRIRWKRKWNKFNILISCCIKKGRE